MVRGIEECGVHVMRVTRVGGVVSGGKSARLGGF